MQHMPSYFAVLSCIKKLHPVAAFTYASDEARALVERPPVQGVAMTGKNRYRGAVAWGRWLAFAAMAIAEVSQATPAYPEKPITLVIPFSAGSETDYFARLLIAQSAKYLPEATMIGDNRAGESGTKAAAEVKLAPADGYTLMSGRLTTQALAPAFKPSVPYRWNDFTFLGLLEIEPMICAVNPKSPYRDARSFLAAARKSPGALKFGHTGAESITYLTAQYFFKLGGLKRDAVVAVNAGNASADAIAGVADGHQDLTCTPAGSMLEPVRSGKLRPLFTTAPARIPQLPALKNARESGFADLGNLVGGSLLVGPVGLPAQVIARWKRVLAQIATDPEWIAGVAQRGAIQTLGTSKDNERFVKEQAQMYQRLVTSMGLQQPAP